MAVGVVAPAENRAVVDDRTRVGRAQTEAGEVVAGRGRERGRGAHLIEGVVAPAHGGVIAAEGAMVLHAGPHVGEVVADRSSRRIGPPGDELPVLRSGGADGPPTKQEEEE